MSQIAKTETTFNVLILHNIKFGPKKEPLMYKEGSTTNWYECVMAMTLEFRSRSTGKAVDGMDFICNGTSFMSLDHAIRNCFQNFANGNVKPIMVGIEDGQTVYTDIHEIAFCIQEPFPTIVKQMFAGLDEFQLPTKLIKSHG